MQMNDFSRQSQARIPSATAV